MLSILVGLFPSGCTPAPLFLLVSVLRLETSPRSLVIPACLLMLRSGTLKTPLSVLVNQELFCRVI